MEKDSDWKKIVEHYLHKYDIDEKEAEMITSAIVLIKKLIGEGTINKETMNKCIRVLNTFYEEFRTIIAAIGNSITTLFILDSIHDVAEVNRCQRELLNVFTKYPQDCWNQRLEEIRCSVDSLKKRQLTMGVFKSLTFLSFGYFSWAAGVGVWARAALIAATGMSGAGALLNGVNYYNLDRLMQRMKDDNYLE